MFRGFIYPKYYKELRKATYPSHLGKKKDWFPCRLTHKSSKNLKNIVWHLSVNFLNTFNCFLINLLCLAKGGISVQLTILLWFCAWNCKSWETVIAPQMLKVCRSRNMKQKICEVLTSPKIQTNSGILNNCRLGMFMFWQIAVYRPLSSASLIYLVCNYF